MSRTVGQIIAGNRESASFASEPESFPSARRWSSLLMSHAGESLDLGEDDTANAVLRRATAGANPGKGLSAWDVDMTPAR